VTPRFLTSAHRAETARLLPLLYRRLLGHFGPRAWWPGETREEVILGAVLTQNTAWSNVEKALARLRGEGALTLRAVLGLPPEALASLIRPAGYFTLKTRRLRSIAAGIIRLAEARDSQESSVSAPESRARPASGIAPPRRPFRERGESVDLSPLLRRAGDAEEREALRAGLLALPGAGPETADSILLYAFDAPTCVVDAYTMRRGARHGLFPEDAAYEEVKLLFEALLPRDTDLFNDYHAQIVAVGKEFCRARRPRCEACPLGRRECFAFGRAHPPAEIHE